MFTLTCSPQLIVQHDVYRCNRVPARGTQCAKAIQLLYDAECEEVILYVERKDHTHDEILEGKKASQRINSETKEVINRIIKQPPKDIRKALGDAKHRLWQLKLHRQLTLSQIEFKYVSEFL